MSGQIRDDLTEMTRKLCEYVDKGRKIGYHEVVEEPIVAVRPEVSRIKSLKRVNNSNLHFLAVDCSTRTLKRASNWGMHACRRKRARFGLELSRTNLYCCRRLIHAIQISWGRSC